MFGRFLDRYATDGYGPEVTFTDAIRTAASVGGIESLDLNFPFWGAGEVTVAAVRSALEESGLRALAITPEIYTQEFRAGSFTNPDGKVRRRAIDLIARATEVGHELGVDYMKIWPGQDGFDYPLQADPRRLWELSVDGMQKAAGPYPEMPFAIEYKPKEPRTHMFFSDAARTLLAIDDIALGNVGILLDFGHSLYAGESPTAAADLCLARGRLIADDTPQGLARRSRYYNAVTLRLPSSEQLGVAREALSSLSDVASVEVLEHELRVTALPRPGASIINAVTAAVAAHALQLQELHLESGRLDEVFRCITV